MFEKDQYIIYQDHNRLEVGKIKRIKDFKSAWIWYGRGSTAALTPLSKVKPIDNEDVIHDLVKSAKTLDFKETKGV